MKKIGCRLLPACLFLFLTVSAFAQRRAAPSSTKYSASLRQSIAKKSVAQKGLAARLPHTLSCTTDSLVFTRQSQIDSFPITNPGCTVLRELRIYGNGASPAITNLDSLYAITEITSFFEIDHTSLTNLNGLSGLQRTAWLWLGYNPLMTSIRPPNVTHIGSVLLNELPLFTSFTGFTQNLASTKLGYLWLFNNVGVSNFNGLQSLDTVENLAVFGVQSLTSMQGLQNVTYANDIGFYGCGNLTNVSALSGITELPYGSLKINYCYQLTNWNGLQQITRLGGILEVQGSDVTSLNGLNPALVIENSQWSDDTVRIENNYRLMPCGFQPLCNYLSGNAAAVIRDNDPSCSDLADVLAACGGGFCPVVNLKTWNGSNNNDWNDAANWTPLGVPQFCDSVVIDGNTPNQPKAGGNIILHALRLEGYVHLNMDNFSLFITNNLWVNDAYVDDAAAINLTHPAAVYIANSSLNADSVAIIGIRGAATIAGSSFSGHLTLTDSAARVGTINLGYGNDVNGNLSVTQNSTAALTLNAAVDGNAVLTQNAAGAFAVGYHGFSVEGNLTVRSNFPNGIQFHDLSFTGAFNATHITQTGTQPIVVERGGMYKPGGTVTLDQPVYITNDFKFGSGIVKTAAGKELVLRHNAKVSQTSSASWVWGPIKKIGTSPFGSTKLPVGTQTVQGAIELSNPALATDAYTVEYFQQNPTIAGYDTAQRANTLQAVSGKEWWRITRNAGTSSIHLTLYYDSTRSQKPRRGISDLRVARWTGSEWANEGVGSLNGNDAEAFVRSAAPVSSFGAFTFGYVQTRIPVITVGTVDSIGCRNQSINIPFTVDTALNAGNVFFAQLSDSTGSFASPVTAGSLTSTNSGTISAYIPGNTPLKPGFKFRVIGTSPRDTSINTAALRIKQKPAPFTIIGQPVICAGGTHKYFASQKEDSVNYTWSNNQPMLPVVYTADTATASPTTGAYFFSLQLAATNFCGNTTAAIHNVEVLPPPPTATPTLAKRGRWLDASQPLPAGANVYRWFRNDTLITGATAASYYASPGGTYTVKFANSCGEGPASNALSYAANAVPQSITLTPVADKVFSDSTFVVQAAASSGLPVELVVISGPGAINANVFTITGTGTVILRATQPGNDVYDTTAYVLDTFVINKASQVITFAAIANRLYSATPFALAASTTSLLPITYSVVSGPATVNNHLLTVTGVGTVTVRAAQPGNTNYLAALPVDRTFCVGVPDLNGINGPVTICPGTAATYTTDSIPGAVYHWRLANGNSFASATRRLVHTWPSPGTYTLIVNASGPCGAPSAADTLVVTAITSVAPDSVRTMLPADGAINLQLPLTLSWIPTNPSLYYTYDVYVWKATDPQPSTPVAVGITAVNYTLTAASGLAYNTTYQWMVVAYNGSCTRINTGPVQQFRLIPLPDLQVFNVTAPATAFSGTQVSVTWKVKNNGPGNTLLGQRWTDAVFISKDSTLVVNNTAGIDFPIVGRLMATKTNVSALNVGQEYRDTASFTLPIDYSGPLYFHVVTNYQPPVVNPVVETTLANDTAHALPATTVTLSPQPDFRVDTVTNPGNTFSGSTINVTFKVKNWGVTATGSWLDKVYLSKDAVFNPATALRLYIPTGDGRYFPQIPLDLYRANSSLQADSSYTVSVQAVVPNFIFGQYYVWVQTNATASIYEGPNGGNNLQRGNLLQVFLTPTPKLVPTNVSIPSVIGTAQTVAFSWTTKNEGAYDNIQKNLYPFPPDSSRPWGRSTWFDRAFISTDSSLVNVNAALRIADVQQFEDIYPGKLFPVSRTWQVPDNQPTGDYWLYVFTNATRSVFEYPGDAQIVRSGKITVVKPDLTVPSVTATATGASGQPLQVSYTVQNNSGGEVTNRFRKDYFYLGANATFDGTAVLIDSAIYTTGVLPANGSVVLQKAVTLPNGVGGAKYLFVKANGAASFSEASLANNTSVAGAPVNISLMPPPDLIVASINVGSPVASNTGFAFAYTVTNNGSGVASGAWKDSLFISCNSSFNAGTAYYVAERPQQVYLAAGQNYTDSFNLMLPQTYLINNAGCLNGNTVNAYFFVKTNANNGVYEAITSNNVGGSTQRTINNITVDHVVTSVRHADTAFIGRNTKVVWTVKNLGLNPADNSYTAWNDGVYLSTDTVLSANDYFVGGRSSGTRLNQGVSYNDSTTIYIYPIPAGLYYVLVRTNYTASIPAERVLVNNTGTRLNASLQPSPIYIAAPPLSDLVTTIVSAPTAVAAGQPITIRYTVTNNGVGAAFPNSWTDNIWLSNSLAPGGLLLGQRNAARPVLPGQSYTDSITATIPLNYTQGAYVLVVHVGIGVYESNAANNIAFRYASVYTQPEVDLVVNNIAVADTVTLGYSSTVSWRLRNISGNKAEGLATDGVYLSTDSSSANTADVLIGTKQNLLNILPLNDSLFTLQPVFSGVPEGSYYLKVRTDILRNIRESNTANNTGLLNKKVYVQVRALPMNTVVPDALTTAYLYYKLTIPAALIGRTVQVKLTSNDSLTATNQLFIGMGYLPSAARFDYSHSAAGGGNQQIILESVDDTVYYIAARSVRPGTQSITLQAIELPFALLTVNSNRGGNSGNVTVLLKGTRFVAGMTAKLRGTAQNNTLNAVAFYFINGTTAYATFNLRGAPLGVYDVSLTKPDASVAALPSSFTVEATSSGGVVTGGSNNTGQTGSGGEPGCDPGAAGGLNTQLQTELVIPPKVFNNWPFVITINYTNSSNVDIPAAVRVLYSHDGSPLALTEAGLADGKTSLALEFKDAFGAPNVIRAGSTGSIRVYSKAPPSAGAHAFLHFNLQ